jgi:hypothetical protein
VKYVYQECEPEHSGSVNVQKALGYLAYAEYLSEDAEWPKIDAEELDKFLQ